MSKLLLKISTKSGRLVVDSMKPSSTIYELKEHLSPVVKIPVPNIYFLSGFPPKILECDDQTKTLTEVGIKSGDSLIVEERLSRGKKDEVMVPRKEEVNSEVIMSRKEESKLNKDSCPSVITSPGDQDSEGGLLMRQIVPADNSCLFTSLGFVLGGKVDTTCGSYMRQIIAEELQNNPEEYSEAILGKPPTEYCEWILRPDSWGGAIELSALSRHYGLEIAVVDTQSGVINRFGEDKHYNYRVFLIFDGIHYDPLYREPLQEGDANQTMFLCTNEKVLRMAEELAREAKTSKQYTDVNRFTLRCLVCRQELTGQSQAQTHAQQTGHLNFGEIDS